MLTNPSQVLPVSRRPSGPPGAQEFEATLRFFERAGIPVFPAEPGGKGSHVPGWPDLPAEEAWARTRRALASGRPVNLAGRTGGGWAVLDLDAKGRDPDGVLEALLPRLQGAVLGVVRTARGLHVWVRVTEDVPSGPCAALGGEVRCRRLLTMLPPSLHPSGHRYRWIVGPRIPERAADLRALGLVPDANKAPKANGRRAGTRRDRPSEAAPAVRAEFEELLAEVGIRPAGARPNELFLCPWHAERGPSLSIRWGAAVFYCFGCGVQGGVAALRRLVRGDTPSYRQEPGSDRSGDNSGCDAEVERLAAACERLGEHRRAQALRQCRQFFRVGRCSECEATPAFPLSCGEPLCPRCMPRRLAADWERRGTALPDEFDLYRLWPRGLVGEPDAVRRARSRFVEWRGRAGLEAGVYGVRWHRERGACVLLAVPAGSEVRTSPAFEVERVAQSRSRGELIGWLQAEYSEEARSWERDEELAALLLAVRGRRRFQGFGAVYGRPTREEEMDDQRTGAEEATTRVTLGRVSGGAGRGKRPSGPPACPFCGGAVELLRRTVPADQVITVAGGYVWEVREDDFKSERWREP
jgi:hypothetical protein